MLRPATEGQRDSVPTEYEEDRPAQNSRRRCDIKSSPSKRKPDLGSPNPDGRFESMCWVDTFEEEFFGGGLTRLRAGDHKEMKKSGSIIVGPDALARCIDTKTNKVHTLQSRKVCPSISFPGNPFPLRIEVVSAIETSSDVVGARKDVKTGHGA
jgi:hypothetical protein